MEDNIWHVYPRNDKEDHLLTTKRFVTDLQPDCKCSPQIIYEGDAVIIVHNSFDGREGLEWANEILK